MTGQHLPQQNISIKLEQTRETLCEHCGSMFFKQAVAIRIVPKLLVGAPQDVMQVIPVFRCDDCGQPAEQFYPEGLVPTTKSVIL